jgi:hypothetical protein
MKHFSFFDLKHLALMKFMQKREFFMYGVLIDAELISQNKTNETKYEQS